MGLYYLSDLDRHTLEQRGHWSALGEGQQPGHFALFNKNANTTLHVKAISQVPNRAEWVVECDAVPAYYAGVLRPVDPDVHRRPYPDLAAEGHTD